MVANGNDTAGGACDQTGGRSAVTAVVEQLRAAINDGSYPPGARLVERRVATELGVSHIPVREALTRLEEEGLVVRLPRRGARVAELSARTLDEISSLRVVLEQFVVQRVQAAWTARAQADLQAIVDEMIGAATRHDTTRVLELDQLFHERLWRLADHQILIEVAAQMRGRTNRFFRAAASSLPVDDLRKHAETHQHLLDVIASGTPTAAATATRRHVEIAARRIAEANGLVDDG